MRYLIHQIIWVFLLLFVTSIGLSQNKANTDSFQKRPVLDNQKLEGTRSLEEYYQNRAILNGPPVIPHVVDEYYAVPMNKCLSCHLHGSYVPTFQKYAPQTPHPELSHCRQCHMADNKVERFKKNNFQVFKLEKVGSLFPKGPPVIPHDFQMRTNCLGCHSGPSSPKEIRTTHPERIHCRQCHMKVDKLEQKTFKSILK